MRARRSAHVIIDLADDILAQPPRADGLASHHPPSSSSDSDIADLGGEAVEGERAE
jgi:hypothetical protein